MKNVMLESEISVRLLCVALWWYSRNYFSQNYEISITFKFENCEKFSSN